MNTTESAREVATRTAGDRLWFDDHVVLGGIREKRLRDLAECEALSALPRNAQDMTAGQRASVVDYYASLSLRELRKRQDLNNDQIGRAYAMRLRDTLIHLQEIDTLLAEAVGRK